MRKEQFVGKYKHLNVNQTEIERKWRLMQEQEEMQRMWEAAQLFNTTTPTSTAGGGGGNVNPTTWIDIALESLNLRYEEITNLIPEKYCFWDDYTKDNDNNPLPGINDGGDDMYDGGNYLNTNLTNLYDVLKEGNVDDGGVLAAASIPYTHTQADNEDDDPNQYFNPPMDGEVRNGDSYFGVGSEYFTNMYPGLFVMVSDSSSVSEFSITGDLGSDSDTINGGDVTEVVPGWSLFYKANYGDSSDPSINHLILVPGTPMGITHQFEDDDSDDYDDHAVFGIEDRSRIVYAVVATHPGEPALDESQFVAIAQKILEIIL